ncbi:MAG: hypothetical protein MHM6MM_003716 [Cercozoa sp. M6MM]
MFFIIKRSERVQVDAKYFGPDLKSHVMHKVRKKFEGVAREDMGYVLMVQSVLNMDALSGELQEDGSALFNVDIMCVVFRPFRNEVLTATVTTVLPDGFFCECGPVDIYISNQTMPKDFRYDDAGEHPRFLNDTDVSYRLEQGTLVRVKVIGMRCANNTLRVVGSINEDYLGPMVD